MKSDRVAHDDRPLTRGAPIIAIGLIVGGVSVFAVQFLARRWLADEGWGWFSLTWSLIYLAAPVITSAVEVAVISGSIDVASWGSRTARGVVCGAVSIAAVGVTALCWDARPVLAALLVLVAVVGIVTNIDARARLTTSGRYGAYAAITVAESVVRLVMVLAAELVAPGDWRWLGISIALAPYVAVPMAWGADRPDSLSTARMRPRDAFLIGVGSSAQVLVMNSAAIAAWMFDRSLAANQFTDLIVPKAIGFVVQPAQIVLLPLLVRDRTLDARRATRAAGAVVLGAGAVLSIGAALFFGWGPDLFGGRTAPGTLATLIGGVGAAIVGCAILVTQQDLAVLRSGKFAAEWAAGSIGAVVCATVCLAVGINPMWSLAAGGTSALLVWSALLRGAANDRRTRTAPLASVPLGVQPVESRET